MNSSQSISLEASDTGQTEEWVTRRRQIIATAAQVFCEMGYERGTTKEIAQRIGLSQPAVYYYVGSKPDLMGEIARAVDRDLTAALDRAVGAGDDPVAQLRHLIINFTVAALDNLDVFTAYWNEHDHIPAEISTAVQDSESRFIERITHIVTEVQQTGALPARHPSVVARGIIGMVYATYRWYQPSGDLRPREIAQVFVDTLCLDE